MSVMLWIIAAVIGVALTGLGFTVGWVIAHRDTSNVRLVQVFMGAGFVVVALVIVVMQTNLYARQQDAIKCNIDIVKALEVRTKAQTLVNQAGIHFHKHMLLWMNAEAQETHGNWERDAETQLKESLTELINAREAAITIEQAHPMPDCR